MLHLQDLAKQGQQGLNLILNDRLPDFIVAPCQLKISYQVEHKDDFYLINLEVAGDLTCICQRCLKQFSFSYENKTVIAVCRNDERAEQILEHYECIVSSNWQVDLNELIIDELHLYAPQIHPDINDCDDSINQFLSGKSETY